MKAGGGKSKGGDFERLCCRRLSLWVSGGTRDDLFWRSAASGARATFQLKKGIVNLSQSGDMTAIAPEGYPLCEMCLFEFKSYANLQVTEGLVKGTGHLATFWHRVCMDAVTYGKQPVLIAKQNHLPVLVLIQSSFFLFPSHEPLFMHQKWGVSFYLFEDVTQVRKVFTRGAKSENM